MIRNTVPPGAAQALIELRRARILAAVARSVRPVGHAAAPLLPGQRAFLRREAEDLYWNELAWEEMTDEEAITGGHLTELVFPGFLTFVDGLLAGRDADGPVRPHPDAVEAILSFLGERYAELSRELASGADSQRVVWARAMTGQLIDLVFYRLYRLDPAEQAEVETFG